MEDDAIIKALVLSGVILGIYGYYGYITGNIGTETQMFWWDTARYWGIHYTEATRNADIHYIAFPFIALLTKDKKGIVEGLLLVFFATAMVLSMARNTWLCIAIVMLAYMNMHNNSGSKFKFIVIGLTALVIGYFILDYFNITDYFIGKVLSVFSMSGTETVSNSNETRWSLILTTIRIISEHIFGVGAEQLSFYYNIAGLNLNHAENTYLNIWAEMGIISFVSYAFIVWAPFLSIMHVKKMSSLSRREKFVFLACLYFGLTILFNTETINCYMWIIFGIIWLERKLAARERIENVYAYNKV